MWMMMASGRGGSSSLMDGVGSARLLRAAAVLVCISGLGVTGGDGSRSSAAAPLLSESTSGEGAAAAAVVSGDATSSDATDMWDEAREYSEPGLAESVGALTGAHTRVVWMRYADEVKDDEPNMWNGRWLLAGYDSADGGGDRLITTEPGGCFMPMLTGDGRRVVFTDGPRHEVVVINFDGSGRRVLCKGLALETWRDLKTGVEYALVQRSADASDESRSRDQPVYKVNIDDASDVTLWWDRTPVEFNNLQLSRSGDRVAIEAPNPRCIWANPKTGGYEVFGRGCYPSMAPDESGMTWHMDGSHRHLYLFSREGTRWRRVAINDAPGFDGRQVHQPRWSNHVRYMVIAGPYADREERQRPDEVEIYMGRFSADYQQIEQWARVCRNDRYEMFPDAWVAGGASADAPALRESAGPGMVKQIDHWPGDSPGLLLAWDHAMASNRVAGAGGREVEARLEATGLATFARDFGADARGGVLEMKGVDSGAAMGAIREAGEASLEVVFTADSTRPGESGLVAWLRDAEPARGHEDGLGNMGISAWRGALWVYVRLRREEGEWRSTWQNGGAYEAGRPVHVLASVGADRVAVYVNGEARAFAVDVKSRLGDWLDDRLCVGEVREGEGGEGAPAASFSGVVRRIALHRRFIGRAEAKVRAAAALAGVGGSEVGAGAEGNEGRDGATGPARLVVEATLRKRTSAPSVKSILPYRRCLVQNEYVVDRVIEGESASPRIVVAQWSIMDGEVIERDSSYVEGEQVRLTLEALDAHPELKAERMAIGGIDTDLPVYYDRERLPADKRPVWKQFRDAVNAGSLEVVRELLAAQPALATETAPWFGDEGRAIRPIQLAAEQVQIWRADGEAIVRLLESHGARLDIQTAARAGMLDRVKAMVGEDASLLNAVDELGRTPLMASACVIGWNPPSQQTADWLMAEGAKVDVFTAAHRGDVEALKGLLKADASLAGARDWRGNTALVWSARAFRRDPGCVETMRMLLDAGADANVVDGFWDRWTPLHWAAEWGGQPEMIDLLVEHGGRVNALDARGRTPLDVARSGRAVRERLEAHGGLRGEAVRAKQAEDGKEVEVKEGEAGQRRG